MIKNKYKIGEKVICLRDLSRTKPGPSICGIVYEDLDFYTVNVINLFPKYEYNVDCNYLVPLNDFTRLLYL